MPISDSLTYKQAIERLEHIVSQIDSDKIDIDQLADSIKEANELIAFCTAKLTKANEEVDKLLSVDNGSQALKGER